MKYFKSILSGAMFLTAVVGAASAQVATNSTFGVFSNMAIHSTTGGSPSGLYIIPSAGLPTVCATSLYGFLWAPLTEQSLIAYALSAEARNIPVRVIVDGTKNAAGYCIITAIYKN
jgi:hypothetical protein